MPYIGRKMSENAAAAYDNDEKPWSKWTRDEIYNSLWLTDDQIQLFDQLTAEELRSELLTYAGWHHTGSYYHETKFYFVDPDKATMILTEHAVKAIVARRKANRKKPTKKAEPTFVSGLVEYTYWTGSRNYRTPNKVYGEYVQYRSDQKSVETKHGRKRLTSLFFLVKKEQKTRFASEKQLLKLKEMREREQVKQFDQVF